MAFTENYAILNDFPLFWDPELLEARRARSPRFHRGHAVAVRGDPAPRRSRRHPLVRGRPDLRAALHQRLRGRRRDRARRVLPGRPRAAPTTATRRPSGSEPSGSWRWTGCRPGCTAGGSTWSPGRPRRAAVRQHHRVRHDQLRLRRPPTTATPMPPPASRAGSCSTGWSSTTCTPAPRSGIAFGDGVYGSETAMAPRVGQHRRGRRLPGHHHHRMNADASYCLVFDAARVADGPVCKLHCRNGFPVARTRPGWRVRSCGAGT